MEFWLHSECGLTYDDIAGYTPDEIQRLAHGAKVRNEKREREAKSGQKTGVSESQRKREREAKQKYA